MRFSAVLATIFGLILAACQTQPATPMLPRSVQIDADSQDVSNKILERRIAHGYIIRQQTPNLLVMDRPASGDFTAQFVYGSNFNIVPNYRLTYQFIGSNPTTVHVSGAIITNPGSGFEKPSDMNNHPSMNDVVREIQSIDNELSAGS